MLAAVPRTNRLFLAIAGTFFSVPDPAALLIQEREGETCIRVPVLLGLATSLQVRPASVLWTTIVFTPPG